MEDNFALALTVFCIGLVALIATACYIFLAHRHWEAQEVVAPHEEQEELD